MRTVLSGNILSMQIEPADVLAIRDMGDVRTRIEPALLAILDGQQPTPSAISELMRMMDVTDAAPSHDLLSPDEAQGDEPAPGAES